MAKQVAEVLGVPMNVIVTRKIGYPRQPELGVGAIAEGLGTAVYDASLLAGCRFPQPTWPRSSPPSRPNWPGACRCTGAVARCRRLAGRCVIVVDDGLATGRDRAGRAALAACGAGGLSRAGGPGRGARRGGRDARGGRPGDHLGDASRFRSVGQWYTSFRQLTDADVLALLD